MTTTQWKTTQTVDKDGTGFGEASVNMMDFKCKKKKEGYYIKRGHDTNRLCSHCGEKVVKRAREAARVAVQTRTSVNWKWTGRPETRCQRTGKDLLLRQETGGWYIKLLQTIVTKRTERKHCFFFFFWETAGNRESRKGCPCAMAEILLGKQLDISQGS